MPTLTSSGAKRTGLALLSYGFRPFFLAAGIWGLAAMAIWVLAVASGINLAGAYGASAWHAHEMLFGYTSAALAGFLLTAIPNWTGRPPISGLSLLLLFVLWCFGRLALLGVESIGVVPAAAVDIAFLPVLLAFCAREIIAARKWKDLKILAGILALALANLCFHAAIIWGDDVLLASRLGTAAYLMLIMLIGGRIVPVFTRNWLSKRGKTRLPITYNGFDTVALLVGVAGLAAWVAAPQTALTGNLCAIAALVHAVRLTRWRGWTTGAEGLVLVLHLAYGFVVLGFAALSATAFGALDPISSLHVLTVGCVGTMTLAVMTRVTRGHTGQ
ncbi:MAG TPA: NnrS family protein, partial [Devosia sp.]|nr:NnrS family protein [Devosia sp.]